MVSTLMMCLSVVQLLDNWFAFCILDSLALTIGVFFSTCISAWMKERSPLSRWTWSLPPMRIQTRWEFELFSFESSCQPIQATLTRFMSGTAQLNSCDHFFHIWKPSSWSLRCPTLLTNLAPTFYAPYDTKHLCNPIGRKQQNSFIVL